VLIHWRILLNLLPNLTSAQREEFRKIGASYKIPLLPESSTDEETSEDSPQVRSAVSVKKTETLDA